MHNICYVLPCMLILYNWFCLPEAAKKYGTENMENRLHVETSSRYNTTIVRSIAAQSTSLTYVTDVMWCGDSPSICL